MFYTKDLCKSWFVALYDGKGLIIDWQFSHPILNRLLVLCLLEYEGIRYMVRDFSESLEARDYDSDTLKQRHLPFFSRVAQLVASVPDKMRPKAPIVLSSQYPWLAIPMYSKDLQIEFLLENERFDHMGDFIISTLFDSCTGLVWNSSCRKWNNQFH